MLSSQETKLSFTIWAFPPINTYRSISSQLCSYTLGFSKVNLVVAKPHGTADIQTDTTANDTISQASDPEYHILNYPPSIILPCLHDLLMF